MDIIPAVVPLYVVLTTAVVPLYYVLNTLIYRRIYVGHAAVPPHIYVHNTTRVGIHIAWRAQETGVATHRGFLQPYTIDVVYTYILKYIYTRFIKMSKNSTLFL